MAMHMHGRAARTWSKPASDPSHAAMAARMMLHIFEHIWWTPAAAAGQL